MLASDIRMNGTQRVATDILTYTVFPKSATTSYVMTMPVQYSGSTAEAKVRVWMTARGPGSGRVTVTVYWLPIDMTGATYTAIPGTSLGTTSVVLSNTSTATLGYFESD